MAKNYIFDFNAQLAEKYGSGYTVVYGGPETRLKRERREMTWKDAQAYAKGAFQEGLTKPAHINIFCANRPVPPGYRGHCGHFFNPKEQS